MELTVRMLNKVLNFGELTVRLGGKLLVRQRSKTRFGFWCHLWSARTCKSRRLDRDLLFAMLLFNYENLRSRRQSFSLRKKLTSASTQKRRNTPRFRTLLFGKETVKTFFYKCSNSGRNESTPQTQNNVSWISSKAELEISFLNSRLEMWVWESGPKIDPATGVKPNKPFRKYTNR